MAEVLNETIPKDAVSRKREREPAEEAENGTGNYGDSRKRIRESLDKAGESILTEQEAAIYDRQIRVWGVEAQRRLSKARVLVVGMSGVIAETCKNIVLAGIGSLTLIDDSPATLEAASTNFLICPEDLENGIRSVASVCAEALREYNPMVNVDVKIGHMADKPGEFFDSFDAVVLDRASLNLKKHVNAVCRSRPQKVAFYAVDCRFSYGSLFVDLQTISYTSKKKADDEFTENTKAFPSLEGEPETRKVSTEDLPALLDFAREYLPTQGLSLSVRVEKLLQNIVETGSSELPPVSAIMGGILGQEIIKALSGKGEPLKNYFFFDTAEGKGIIEDISPKLSLEKGKGEHKCIPQALEL